MKTNVTFLIVIAVDIFIHNVNPTVYLVLHTYMLFIVKSESALRLIPMIQPDWQTLYVHLFIYRSIHLQPFFHTDIEIYIHNHFRKNCKCDIGIVEEMF